MRFFGQSSKVGVGVGGVVDNDASCENNPDYGSHDDVTPSPKRNGMLQKEKSIFQNLNPDNDASMPDLNPADQKAYDTIKRLQYIMDDCIRIPCCGGRRMGLDPILGFVPGVGDFASSLVSLAIIARVAPQLSRYTILRMLVNVWIDTVTGVFPLLGDLFDIGWKANERNVAIFEDHMKVGSEARMQTDRRWIVMVVLGFVAICVVTTLIVIGITFAIIWLVMSKF